MDFNCLQCGQVASRPPSQVRIGGKNFCTAKCMGVYRHRRVTLQCAICGKPVTAKASVAAKHKAITCSPECLSAYRSRMIVAFHNSQDSRVATCTTCGKGFTRKPVQLRKYKDSFCSRACHAKSLEGTNPFPPECRSRRENHYMWKGGVRSHWPVEFNSILRRMIRERDGYRCRICKSLGNGRKLSVHHLDEDKQNSSPDNLASLCGSCHTLIHNWKVVVGGIFD